MIYVEIHKSQYGTSVNKFMIFKKPLTNNNKNIGYFVYIYL